MSFGRSPLQGHIKRERPLRTAAYCTIPRLPSGCDSCRAFAEKYVAITDKIGELLRHHKLSAMRHKFDVARDAQTDINGLLLERSRMMSEIEEHYSSTAHIARAQSV